MTGRRGRASRELLHTARAADGSQRPGNSGVNKQSANQSGHRVVEFYSIFHFSQEFVKIVNILKIFYTPFEFPDSSNILLNFVDI